MKKIYILGVLAACGLASCKPNIEPKAPERGDADFSRYLAVGSSHTAGIMDGAYYRQAQFNSYPLMLSEQFKTVGGGQFKQPYVPGEYGWPLGKKVLAYYQGPCDTATYISIQPFRGALDTAGTATNIFATGPFNNMGLPGAKVVDYNVPAFGLQNGYAARMFRSPNSARMLEELELPAHTFFTAWLGIDDVLDYALAGGDRTSPPAGYRGALTDPYTFEFAYDSVVNVLTRRGAKGMILTIPNIMDMPFFRSRSIRSLNLTIGQANKLNLQYNGTQVHFDEGMNTYVIEDKSTKEGFRQIREGESILMTIPEDSIRCHGWGSAVPIPERYVLTSTEIDKIESIIEVYNGVILKIANHYDVPVSDTRYFLKTIADGGKWQDGVGYNFDIMSASMFSLDGLHFTGRGNAMLSNWIINSINTHYKASLPMVDVNKYSGIRRP